MLGPFATASRRTPIHQVSLLSHATTVTRRLHISVYDNDINDNNNDNVWQTGPPWPHRMGPINRFGRRIRGDDYPDIHLAVAMATS